MERALFDEQKRFVSHETINALKGMFQTFEDHSFKPLLREIFEDSISQFLFLMIDHKNAGRQELILNELVITVEAIQITNCNGEILRFSSLQKH